MLNQNSKLSNNDINSSSEPVIPSTEITPLSMFTGSRVRHHHINAKTGGLLLLRETRLSNSCCLSLRCNLVS